VQHQLPVFVGQIDAPRLDTFGECLEVLPNRLQILKRFVFEFGAAMSSPN
jgi:hypothetical protein